MYKNDYKRFYRRGYSWPLQSTPRQFSLLETEALVVEAGILLAKEMDLQQIIIESNSLSVVSSIF